MIAEAQIMRSIDRKRVLMRAAILSIDGTQEVRVNDFTASGARVTWDRPVPADEDVVFRRGELFVAARVAWSKRGSAGIEFYRELSPSELASSFHPVFENVA